MYCRYYRAAAFLLASLLLSNGPLLANDSPPTADKGTGHTPTLLEIARANEASWQAIKSVDMEYVLTMKCVENGKTQRETQAPARWSKAGNLERLRQYPNTVEFGCPPNATFGGHEQSEDFFLDGKTIRHLWDRDPKNKNKGGLTLHDQKQMYADIRPEVPRSLVVEKKHPPELLRYFRFEDTPPLTLSELITTWKVSVTGKHTNGAGDTLWSIHAEYPPKHANDKLSGSYMDICVNADKGFLVERVTFYENGAAWKAGKPIGFYSTCEVEHFQDCGHSVYFPKQVTCRSLGETEHPRLENGYFRFTTFAATKLSVNSRLPNDTFDFRFPENIVVQEIGTERFLVWGPDNKPAREFNTVQEFNRYIEKDELESLRQRVEKNRSSKQPSDLIERGVYLLQTKNYDAAIAAYSEAISIDPKACDALLYRGMAYLFFTQDYVKSVADFTECLQREPEKENVAMCRYLRGLAYASQKGGLEKAVADMTEALRLGHDIQECLAGAYLVRSVAEIRKGNLAEALADATKATEKNPKKPDAYSVRCYVYEKKGDHDKAKTDRNAAKRLRGEPSNSNDMEIAFADALHRCLLQHVPDLE